MNIRSATALLLLLLAAMTAAPSSAQPGKPNTGLPLITLTIGTAKLQAEVASTPLQREVGLMYRFSLAPDQGMLFVFEAPQPQSFWMKNTYVPLSIAFIAEDGTILNIEDMTPHELRSHWSRGAALYALEMKQGWFRQKGIAPGAKVSGLPKVN